MASHQPPRNQAWFTLAAGSLTVAENAPSSQERSDGAPFQRIKPPSMGRTAGLHQYDGKVADYSAAGIAARLARVEKERAELAAVDKSTLTPDEALDLALLLQHADMTIKQRALDRTTPASITPGRYRPNDTLLAFLEGL